MWYLLSIGTFLAGAAFVFRSIAWAFGQAALPYRSQPGGVTSDRRLRADVKEERVPRVEEETPVSI